MRIIQVLGFGVPYIRDFTIYPLANEDVRYLLLKKDKLVINLQQEIADVGLISRAL